MALFATLSSTENGESGLTTTNSTSATSPPTAVQLYTTKSFNFLLNTVSNYGLSSDETGGDASSSAEKKNEPPSTPGSPAPRHHGGSSSMMMQQGHPFAVLSYQAVEVPDATSSSSKSGDDDGAVALPLGLRKTANKHNAHLRPNLGVWDCRIVVNDEKEEPSSLVDGLLQSVVGVNGTGKKKSSKGMETFVLAVDLSDPRAVRSAVSSMVEAIARHLEAKSSNGGDEDDENKGGTTTLSSLRRCTFGSASAAPSPSSNENSTTAVNLVICAIVPNPQGSTNKAPPSYKDKQSQNLILYHLHKFALEVDCTLCFVRSFEEVGEKASTNADSESPATDAAGGGADAGGSVGASSFGGGMVGTVSISELATIVRKLALGVSLTETESEDGVSDEEPAKKEEKEEGDSEEKEKEENNEPASTPSAGANDAAQAVYSPGSHDPDILKGVYLRNASCEGEWDAAADDLGKALPPPEKSSSGATLANSSSATAGDGEWLGKLYQSVGAMAAAGAESSSGDAAGDKGGFMSPGAGGKDKKKKNLSKKGGKTPQGGGEKNVSDFFENLLKK